VIPAAHGALQTNTTVYYDKKGKNVCLQTDGSQPNITSDIIIKTLNVTKLQTK